MNIKHAKFMLLRFKYEVA